ncbi:MAG: restriction endonuclease subunit S [Saprospiraceae bacterium]|nr:restriction endonuclease subunit S [Saprospiraceae bacterium]
MDDWKTYQLDEVYDFASGLSKPRDQFGFGYGFLTFKDVFHNTFVPDELISLANTNESEHERFSILEGDVFLTRTSEKQEELGMSCVALKDYPQATFNGFTKRLRPNGNTDIIPKYAAYYFQSPVFRRELTSMASITTRASLNNSMLADLKILLPPLPEQKAIAEVLSSLDDKIDLLHRQNKTLEAMAETLFRQWFVEEAEDDWEEKPLSSVGDFLNGLACQKFPPKNDIDKLPVLKIKQLRTGISSDCDWSTTDVDPKYIVSNGDLIFSWSASLMVKLWDGETCILNQHLFKVTSENYPKWFLYQWCKFHLNQFIAIASSHATTMGHIKRKDLDEAIVFVPSNTELENYSEKMNPLLEKVILNNNQINSLRALRDSLLPKLIDGSIMM